VPGFGGIIAFVILFGVFKGMLTLMRPAFIASLYGRARYASIAGVLAFAVTLANATGPVGIGAIYDRTAAYQPVLWLLLVIGVWPAWRRFPSA
jgi:hypothetical protein